ncbi:MAG: hypothetical protein GXY85_01980 [Candidatus Brocadiaceae bacterium]|nr:hypothetical protein [Candidatus Brocadiaceae bacterium]
MAKLTDVKGVGGVHEAALAIVLLGLFAVSLSAFAHAQPDLAGAAIGQGAVSRTPGAGASPPLSFTLPNIEYPTEGRVYYVSPEGTASAENSLERPWNIKHALATADDGSILVLRGGEYRTGDLTIRKSLTIQPYRSREGNEQVWFKGSRVIPAAEWRTEGDKWVKDGWEHSFVIYPSDSLFVVPEYPLAGYGDMVFVDNAPLAQVASVAEVAPGTFCVDATNKKLWLGDNPEGKKVEATVYRRGLATNDDGPAYLTLRGIGFMHYATQGASLRGPRRTVEGCAFVRNGGYGFALHRAANSVIRGCVFSCNANSGMGMSASPDVLIENCVFSHNNQEHFSKSWDAAGIKVTNLDTKRLTFRHNILEHNDATGLWIDINVSGALVYDNISRHNKGVGLYNEISLDNVFAFNTVYGNTIGVRISGGMRIRVYNNTIVDNGLNVRIMDNDRQNNPDRKISRASYDARATMPGWLWDTYDNEVVNNVISGSSGKALVDAGVVAWPEQVAFGKDKATAMVTRSDHNVYYRPNPSTPEHLVLGAVEGKKRVNWRSLADFKEDCPGFGDASVSIDGGEEPSFANAAERDYRPRRNSALVGSAAPLPEDIAKGCGRPVEIGYIGAQEPE